ncbi:MAG TPA: hypothetical protein VGF99_20715 [Myxococcota bacterium]
MTKPSLSLLLLSSSLTLFAVVAGCPSPPPAVAEGITFHKDIAPLLQRECMSCHQQGGIGPFPLTTYDEVVANKELISFSVSTRRMPPNILDNSGDCQTFPDARWLDDNEIATIVGWADGDAVEGTPPATPIAPQPLVGLTGAGIVEVAMAEPYTPAGSAREPNDDYRCFILDGDVPEGWLTGYEIVPGQPQEVHHMLLFAMLTDGADAEVQRLDDADPLPGYTCFGDSGVDQDESNLLAVWAPGRDAVTYPEGTGLAVSPGRKLVMQIHYNLLAGAVADLTALKLRFSTTVAKDALLLPLADGDLALEAGLPEAEWSFSQPLLGLPEPLQIHGVFPHMHTLGRQLRFERARIADASDTECLADVPNWNFHWQEVGFYPEPVTVDGGDRLSISCTYDTSSRTEDIFWGEGTQDEMCLVFVYLTRENGGRVLDLLE